MDRRSPAPNPSHAVLLAALLFLGSGGIAEAGASAAARQGGADRAKLAAEAREALKAGDSAKAKSLCAEALQAQPGSLALRYEIAQIAELRRDNPYLAHAHYSEIGAAAERAAKSKEKLSEEDAKVVKDAANKAKSSSDPFAKDVSKALKAYADSVLKIARVAKSKKYWNYTNELSKGVRSLFNGLPTVLDPKDPREAEAGKLISEANDKRADDKGEPDKGLRGELSEAVAGLSKELNRISDLAKETYEEVRGPVARRRALMPLGILVALQNDPDGNSKRAEAIWKRAGEVEPTAKAKLRIANDASKWTLRLNGAKVAESDPKNKVGSTYRELDVTLFREGNLIGFFGHEISDKKGKAERGDWALRVWVLVDIQLSEKDHFTTDATWLSMLKPPTGWDVCLDGTFTTYPVVSYGERGPWDYETTKNWTGQTVMGDVTDTYIRRVFDLPAGIALGSAAATPPSSGDGK